jgi:hypothetical protein
MDENYILHNKNQTDKFRLFSIDVVTASKTLYRGHSLLMLAKKSFSRSFEPLPASRQPFRNLIQWQQILILPQARLGDLLDIFAQMPANMQSGI